MGADALALALGAAVLHAAWNLRLAGETDTRAGLAIAAVAGAACCAPIALATWDLDASALPWVAASVALELAYFTLLARAYNAGELSLVYPISRGSAPVIVLLVSVAALDASVSSAQAFGVLLVAAGVLAVRGVRSRAAQDGDPAGRGAAGAGQLALALAVGASIAGYTLVDNEGITHGAALSYLGLMAACTAAINFTIVRVRLGGDAVRAAVSRGTVLAGVGMFASYALVLLALERAEAAPVAAVRESSVVIATALAAIFLRERVTPVRIAGSAVVVAGVALIALG